MNTTAVHARIPLSKLHLSSLNARKTRTGDVDDLAASIAAHGLLQNLTVTVNDNPGEFEVVAGGRRLAAMQQLDREGRLPDALRAGVPCLVIENNDVAHEASTAENTLREAMHPADEYEAFSRMVEAGKPVEDIAAHFGVEVPRVKQRLKLARVAPDLLDLYRADEMELSKLQALTVTDDHEAQRQAWEKFGDYSAWQIRQFLVGDKSVRITAPIARFVGIDAYEAAGGVVRRDLFGTDAWCEDPALLDSLALDKLEAKAQQLRDAGWSWAEARLSLEHHERADYPALKPDGVEEYLAPEKQQRYDVIEKRLADIEDLDTDDLDDAQVQALSDEQDALQEEADAIAAEVEERWPAEAMAKAGALVTINHEGLGIVYYGRLRPGEKAGKGNAVTSTPKAAPAQGAKPKKPEISADMKRCLELHRSAALRVALLDQPDLALRMLVATLLAGVSDHLTFGEDYFDITVENVHDRHDSDKYPGLRKSEARVSLDDAWNSLRAPKKPSEIDAWVAKLDAKQLQQVIATCMALALKDQGAEDFKLIEKLLPLDMQRWWQADADRYLAHVNKALILEAVTEARGKDAAAKLATLKRDALIAEAGKLLAGTGWLPKPLRGPGYALKTAAAAKPAAKSKPAKKAAKAKAKPAKKPAAKKAARKIK